MLAWDAPAAVPTNASGTPVLVSAAGRAALVVPDVTGSTAGTAQPIVLTVGYPGRRVIAARGLSMLHGLATSAGSRIAVAGMQVRSRRLRGAVLSGKPGGRLRRVGTLPGPASARLPQATAPGPSVGFFPAGNEPDPAAVVGVAVPVAIAGNARGDIAVLYRRQRPGVLTYRIEVWIKRGSRTRVRTIARSVRSRGAAAVAIDRRGNVLAAWKTGRGVYARTITGGRTSGVVRVGAATRRGPVRALLPARGRGVVAWGSQAGGRAFRAFVATQRGSGFRRRVALGTAPNDEDTYGFAAGVLLAPLPGGATAVAWSGGGPTATAQTATITSGTLTRGPDAGPGRLESLATSATGATAVVMSTARRSITVRAAGAGAFDVPTDLGPTTGILPSAAFDAGARAYVTWRDFRTPVQVSSGAPSER